MFDFFERLLGSPGLDAVIYLLVGVGGIGIAWLEMPGATEKKTKRRRSLMQRWQLAGKRVHAEFYCGCVALIFAALSIAALAGAL
ncbi:MAG: hypothetical protein MR006_00485 [Arcanobacterium sp.]|nr:hypothetical protein [Arcanobacterium sp.]